MGRSASRGPRACGGVPWLRVLEVVAGAWSPRVRGCSSSSASVSRWVSWSPRVRGCSRVGVGVGLLVLVVPARAGVFPPSAPPCPGRPRGPRACGGVPLGGVIQHAWLTWSPRVRGCSPARTDQQPWWQVVPARAGVFPGRRTRGRTRRSGPRACGGVPCSFNSGVRLRRWSPRVRGCSRAGARWWWLGRVVPARAGVFPLTVAGTGGVVRGPRACGGVPRGNGFPAAWVAWSPRVRGCSPRAQRTAPHARVVPARAGVFPSWT